MIAVRMVEVTFHQVVGMVAVRNRFMSATFAVFVALLVTPAIVVRGARFRVLPTYVDLVFVDVAGVRMVEVPIMDVILVAVVLQGSMSAIRAVDMRMPFVNFMIGGHVPSPSLSAFVVV
jgi:hypothetical protein